MKTVGKEFICSFHYIIITSLVLLYEVKVLHVEVKDDAISKYGGKIGK